MPNGFGRRGGGRGGGWGFGFRGSSPPWPFVGVGRGGLPRCGYFLGGAAGVSPANWPNPYFASGWSMPPYGGAGFPEASPVGPAPGSGANPYAPTLTREQELEFLKRQAEVIKKQLEQIEDRMRELEEEE